ncbi:MAG: translation initiation factor [Muribaculaceae bacterium]|nr:translation initiation factor [Muribaculaceae bacterium]MDE6392542.1 translation initiation factor [Muribaculaceae bacterium]
MDWKEMLGQLREDLPQGNAEETPCEETVIRKKDTLRVIVDRKGRKGKVATIIEGFTVSDDEVAAVAASLKKRLGTGGSSRGGEILIQGDVSAKVLELLKADGYKAVGPR